MLTTREVMFIGLIEGLRQTAGDPHAHEGDLLEDLLPLFAYAKHVRDAEQVPDTMPAGWNRPAPASTSELVHVLINAAAHVDKGDSFEGTITWTMPTDETELEGADFGLVARYRVGNRDGQGGVRVFTKEM